MRRDAKQAVGLAILGLFLFCALFAGWLAPGDPGDFLFLAHQPPSRAHWLGTTGHGQDVLAQLVHGTRTTLGVGAVAGIGTTAIGAAVGMSSGYFGGLVDRVLGALINMFLIMPALPLLVILAAVLPPGPIAIALALAVTGWAWPARVLRAQAMVLRGRDFVAAARVSGETGTSILLREVLPNMLPLLGSCLLGACVYALGAQAGLEFLGLGDLGVTSWGMSLYWANTNGALLGGAWWTFVPPGLALALAAFALALLSYGLDERTNPALRAERASYLGVPIGGRRARSATPVVRRG